VETAQKKGDALRDHPGIKNLIKKIPVDLFPPKNVTVKNRHVDFIAPNFANFYRQIFMDGTQKKMKLSRKVITHSSFVSFFDCYWYHVQITKLLHVFLFSGR